MVSSNRFGGRGTTAGSRVQIGSTGGTKPGARFPAQQQVSGSSQGHFLPHHVTDVDVRGPLQQRIEVGIVACLGVTAEHRGININVYYGLHLGEAAPAFPFQDTVDLAPPEIFALAGLLELSGDRHRTDQIQIQPFKRRIVRPKLPDGANRAPLKVPDVDSQHSRLK
jgi:hypothetical protein